MICPNFDGNLTPQKQLQELEDAEEPVMLADDDSELK